MVTKKDESTTKKFVKDVKKATNTALDKGKELVKKGTKEVKKAADKMMPAKKENKPQLQKSHAGKATASKSTGFMGRH